MSKDQKATYLEEFKSYDKDPGQQMQVYSQMVDNLESPVQEYMQAFVSDEDRCRIMHAWVGVTTECGESGDNVKRTLVYGKELDLVNLDEEFCDKLWYLQLYCNVRRITLADLMAMNYAKLRTRYGDKFSQEACFNRDLTTERQNLEASSSVFRVQDLSEGLLNSITDKPGVRSGKLKLNAVASDKAQINLEQLPASQIPQIDTTDTDN